MALTVALLMFPMIAAVGLVVDTGFWLIAATRLQIATDAAAMGDAFMLPQPAFQTQLIIAQPATLRAVALFEATAGAGKLVGTISTTPTITWDAIGYSWVRVTMTTQPLSFFAAAFNVTPPSLSATATASFTAPPTCLLALNLVGTDITVDNSGSVIDSHCAIFSNSISSPSIYLNSGTISGTAIGAAGPIVQSNSGSNTLVPSAVNPNQPALLDRLQSLVAPIAGGCQFNNMTFSGNVSLSPGVYCGTTTIVGNGGTANFAPGIYYIVNGDLNFTNANAALAAGITFVLTGTSPGNFNWVNNSGASLVAPTTGPTAGIAIWQVCNKLVAQLDSFKQGGTLQVSGSIYMPCANVNVSDNFQMQSAGNVSFDMTVGSIGVHGSAGVHTNNPQTSGGTVGTPRLSS